jgi:hypothetical protein
MPTLVGVSIGSTFLLLLVLLPCLLIFPELAVFMGFPTGLVPFHYP